ncbi:hypothetical protein SLEP1_g45135 [Rubroshorea leprosula]|uniref:Uncharacterized protein n=1 Tax=Rubroshorea leprosula TaxID=152421 RepID=A0AAV5LIU1_9ROSI|nr:hypothetical protein SLEP1_g45135 [Rubroshorea leprosula]
MRDEDKRKETKVPSSDLGDHQPSCQKEIISEIHGAPNLPTECPHNVQVQLASEEIGRADDQMPVEQDMDMVPRQALQRLILQTVAAQGAVEATVEDMKNGVKVARLVISISTTGIISILAGVSRSHSSMASKLIFKSGILSMFASLFFALVLLVLSTNNAKLSFSNQSLRILIWLSTGLMTLAVVLLTFFYLLT